MKRLILILGILFALAGCSGDDDNNDIEYRDELRGTWKLVEEWGWPNPWRKVKKSYTYTFDGSGNLISDRFACNGTYQETMDEVTIEFDCPPDFGYHGIFTVSYEDNKLILTGDGCDEGCAEKFKRIK